MPQPQSYSGDWDQPTTFGRSGIRFRYPSGQVVSSTLPLLIHVHALVSTAWLLLLIAQTSLVAANRVGTHRKVGMAGAGLGLGLVALVVLTAVRVERDGWNPGVPFRDSVGFLAVTLGDVVLFSVFIAAGLYYRRRPDWHKRFMLLGTLAGLMWPAITRMPFIAPHPPPHVWSSPGAGGRLAGS